MTLDGGLLDTLAELRRTWDEVEVFYKKGRSRTLSYGPQNMVTTQRQEEGWAVRVGDRRRSFFYASTGSPRPDTPWPEADGHGLRLPSARPIPRWAIPSTFDAPLVGEGEALGLFEGLAQELENELPGARLLSGHLDDGSSESQLLSSREVVTTLRHRTAVLQVEAAAPGRQPRSVSLLLAERDARRFSPAAVARRLADHLAVITRGSAPARDRGEFLLAPPVAIAILDSLAALWVGPRAKEYIAHLVDRRDRIGSTALTLVDDGRFPGGLMEAPTDGEGQPTKEVVLVEEGVFRQPLLTWWQTPGSPNRASGCSLRPGWRGLPQPGPTHLYLKPNPSLGVAALLGGLRRGYYLLAAEGTPRLDLETLRFAVPVSGFSIDSGRPVGSVAGAWLLGSVSTFLNGLLQTARDLTFQMQGGGLVGSPTLHVRGLELRQSP
jgi:predicted Zn-dependent protease